jgi:hypothetical protein
MATNCCQHSLDAIFTKRRANGHFVMIFALAKNFSSSEGVVTPFKTTVHEDN